MRGFQRSSIAIASVRGDHMAMMGLGMRWQGTSATSDEGPPARVGGGSADGWAVPASDTLRADASTPSFAAGAPPAAGVDATLGEAEQRLMGLRNGRSTRRSADTLAGAAAAAATATATMTMAMAMINPHSIRFAMTSSFIGSGGDHSGGGQLATLAALAGSGVLGNSAAYFTPQQLLNDFHLRRIVRKNPTSTVRKTSSGTSAVERSHRVAVQPASDGNGRVGGEESPSAAAGNTTTTWSSDGRWEQFASPRERLAYAFRTVREVDQSPQAMVELVGAIKAVALADVVGQEAAAAAVGAAASTSSSPSLPSLPNLMDEQQCEGVDIEFAALYLNSIVMACMMMGASSSSPLSSPATITALGRCVGPAIGLMLRDLKAMEDRAALEAVEAERSLQRSFKSVGAIVRKDPGAVGKVDNGAQLTAMAVLCETIMVGGLLAIDLLLGRGSGAGGGSQNCDADESSRGLLSSSRSSFSFDFITAMMGVHHPLHSAAFSFRRLVVPLLVPSTCTMLLGVLGGSSSGNGHGQCGAVRHLAPQAFANTIAVAASLLGSAHHPLNLEHSSLPETAMLMASTQRLLEAAYSYDDGGDVASGGSSGSGASSPVGGQNQGEEEASSHDADATSAALVAIERSALSLQKAAVELVKNNNQRLVRVFAPPPSSSPSSTLRTTPPSALLLKTSCPFTVKAVADVATVSLTLPHTLMMGADGGAAGLLQPRGDEEIDSSNNAGQQQQTSGGGSQQQQEDAFASYLLSLGSSEVLALLMLWLRGPHARGVWESAVTKEQQQRVGANATGSADDADVSSTTDFVVPFVAAVGAVMPSGMLRAHISLPRRLAAIYDNKPMLGKRRRDNDDSDAKAIAFAQLRARLVALPQSSPSSSSPQRHNNRGGGEGSSSSRARAAVGLKDGSGPLDFKLRSAIREKQRRMREAEEEKQSSDATANSGQKNPKEGGGAATTQYKKNSHHRGQQGQQQQQSSTPQQHGQRQQEGHRTRDGSGGGADLHRGTDSRGSSGNNYAAEAIKQQSSTSSSPPSSSTQQQQQQQQQGRKRSHFRFSAKVRGPQHGGGGGVPQRKTEGTR